MKEVYKEIGDSVKDLKNYKGKRNSSVFMKKVKKPFEMIKKLPKSERKDLADLVVILISSILGGSILGYLISQGFNKKSQEIDTFKQEIHDAPNVKGKGREMYEKIDSGDKKEEKIIMPTFAPFFGTERRYGIGYDKESGEAKSPKYPTSSQQELLKKLNIPAKWFV